MKRPALAALLLLVAAMAPVPASAQRVLAHRCPLGVPHPFACFSAGRLARAEAIPIFPIDPPGAEVWNVMHLRLGGEAITRYHGYGPVTGIYFAFGRRPTATGRHSRYVLVSEVTHAFAIAGGRGPASGPEWTVTGVLPTTHVMLTVSGNESRSSVRKLTRRILDLARRRMSVRMKTVGPDIFQSFGVYLYKPYVQPRVTRAQLEKVFQNPANPGVIREAALARVIDPGANQNQIAWVVSLKTQAGCSGVSIELVNAWTGANFEGFEEC